MTFQIYWRYIPNSITTKRQRALQILPHIGLVLLSIFHIVIAAAIFHVIELPNEIELKRHSLNEIDAFKRDFANRMWAISRKPNVDARRWSRAVAGELDNFTELLYRAIHSSHLRSEEIRLNSTKQQDDWSFPGSIMFSFSVLTTIGYGTPTPRTTAGRLCCVVFAMLGIPLIWITVVDLAILSSIGALKVYPHCAKFGSMVKAQLLDLIGKIKRRRIQSANTAFATAPPVASDIGTEEQVDGGPNQQLLVPDATQAPCPGDKESSIDNAPIMAVWCLLLYLLLGAALLPLWERGSEWTFFGAFYYCFISITTIGFGDVVPENQKFILATIMYLLVGLLIVLVCIMLRIHGLLRLFPVSTIRNYLVRVS